MIPLDRAKCPNNTNQCPAFYDPSLLPAGYNSVSYCSQVLAQRGFLNAGLTFMTMPLNLQEQQSFLQAADKVESYVRDNVSVTVEVYKVAFLDSHGNNNLSFLGTEFWNPVCGADQYLPPFTSNTPSISGTTEGAYYYDQIPQTYDQVLTALQAKNTSNGANKMALIDYLPSYAQISVQWPSSFYGYSAVSNVESYNLKNFLVAPAGYYGIPSSWKPFTLCGAPSVMKMLGLSGSFNVNGHSIDDINSPAYNAFVTLPGTDGSIVIPDFTKYPIKSSLPLQWIYDATDPSVVSTQLPKAFFVNTSNFDLPKLSCNDPRNCVFPKGVNGGYSLPGVFTHELHHVLGVMQSQYYKVRGEGTALANTYGGSFYLLDLFDVDSDDAGIGTYSGSTAAARNNNPDEPTTIRFVSNISPAGLTPWIQWGQHDHLMLYDAADNSLGSQSVPQYVPLMNNTQFNPDGDIQFEVGFYEYTFLQNGSFIRHLRPFYVDPLLQSLDPKNVAHSNAQSNASRSTIDVVTDRDLFQLASQGWSIDLSKADSAYGTISPIWNWYQTCFDNNGVFTTAKNSNCKYSVTAQDLKFLNH